MSDKGLSYYIIDTETNGLKPGWHEVTEISIIRCADRHQLTRQVAIKHPERSAEQALAITGKTIPDLLSGDSKADVIKACEEFFAQDGKDPEGRCIIAHRASFDKNFCYAMWEEFNKNFPAINWMDTIKFARIWAEKIGRKPENFKLPTVLKFAGIKPMPGQHNASSDARNTYLLWKKGMDEGVGHLPAIKVYRHSLN